MDLATFASQRRFVETSFGRIAYVACGRGPAALFLHGVPLNGAHWRDVLSGIERSRTGIAIDLMGLGHSEIASTQDLAFPSQGRMAIAVMDALGFADFDLVGNDSGGAIAQIVATSVPERVRTLTLTNCDCHDNWPPPAFAQAYALATAGKLADVLAELVDNLALARSDLGLGTAYERPAHLTRELVGTYVSPLVASKERRAQLDRYVASMDNSQTLAIEGALRRLGVPTQILWGTDDVFFPTEWAYWLEGAIPGATRVIEAPGARLFFPEERPEWVAARLLEHWDAATGRSE